MILDDVMRILTLLLQEIKEIAIKGVVEEQVVEFLVCPCSLHGSNAGVLELSEHDTLIIYFIQLLALQFY